MSLTRDLLPIIGWGFFFMKNVNFYIDGFNIYHSIDKMNNNTLKWINYKLLCQEILKDDEQINNIFYFSAYATWKQTSYLKHRVFIRALINEGINIVLGNFKKKTKYIPNIKYNYEYHEEKETDVNIAINLVRDACRNNCDKAVILSGDSDLVPAISMAKTENPKLEIVIVIPPNVKAESLKEKANYTLKLSNFKLEDFLFPKEITLKNNQKIICPIDWQ